MSLDLAPVPILAEGTLPLYTQECVECGGVGFLWVSAQGVLRAVACPVCPGQVYPVTLPRDLLEDTVTLGLSRLERHGRVVCSQFWDRTWPRSKAWLVRCYLHAGGVRKHHDTHHLGRAIARLLAALPPD